MCKLSYLAVVVACFCGSQAHALVATNSAAFDKFMDAATGVGKSTVGFGTGGVPLSSPGVPNLGTDGGMPKMQQSGEWRNPQGNRVPVSGSARMNAAGVAGPLGRFAAKVLGPLAVGIALYDLAKELGFSLGRDAAGNTTYGKESSNCDYSGGGASYVTGNGTTTSYATWNDQIQNYGKPTSVTWRVEYQEVRSKTPGGEQCQMLGRRVYTSVNFTEAWSSWASKPVLQTVTVTPQTNQDFVDAIAARSGWPAASAVSQALADASAATGETLKVDPATVTVTGPATSPGTTSTSTDAVKNETTTTSTTNNHTYAGDTITTNVITTTNTVNNSTGATVTNITESHPAPAPQKVELETCGLPGKPACKLDETGTLADPKLDGVARAADAVKPMSDFARNPTQALPVLPSLVWSFALPSGCSPIAIAAFAPFLSAIDICKFRPMFHDLMGLVWVIGGLFGAISMFWRNTFSLA